MNLTPDQQEKLLSDVAEMKAAIIGDSRYGQKGIVGDVADLKSWRAGMNDKFLWVSGAVAASWFFICTLAYIGYEWLKTKLTHGQ